MPHTFYALTFLYTAVSLVLAACAAPGAQRSPDPYLRQFGTLPGSPSSFRVCNLPGCEETAGVTLSAEDWKDLHTRFNPAAADSATERQQITGAIAHLEYLVGQQAGTYDDQAGGRGSFRGTRQLDCVAETANTTTYLLLLEQQGLLRRHAVGYPRHRGFLNLLMPHNTAVIIDLTDNQAFAVDAYYHANGEPPEIVPLQSWKAGFRPGR